MASLPGRPNRPDPPCLGRAAVESGRIPTVSFNPHRFRTSAPHYVRGRLSYPDELIRRVVDRVGLRPDQRVLDLGCGPGFLAVAFAPHAREVVGLDPEPAMLEAASAYALENAAAVTLLQGSSYDLGEHLGTFDLVTMGRSFHWMDRAATLEILSRIVSPQGTVALFRDHHLDVPENAWRKRFQAILEPYAAQDPAHERNRRRDPAWLPHESILLASAFNRLERMSVIHRLATPAERLIDRALSQSTTSPERLGPDLDAVVDALRRLLREAAPQGFVAEVVESEALVAFRGQPTRSAA